MPIVCAAAWSRIDVSGPCRRQGLFWVCGPTAAGVFLVCAVARNQVETHNLSRPRTAQGKEIAFAVMLITADTQVRKRDMEDVCDNHYHPHKLQQHHKQDIIEKNS